MITMQAGTLDFARMDHAERMREAERFRRARKARLEESCRTAARNERRFSFLCLFAVRMARA